MKSAEREKSPCFPLSTRLWPLSGGVAVNCPMSGEWRISMQERRGSDVPANRAARPRLTAQSRGQRDGSLKIWHRTAPAVWYWPSRSWKRFSLFETYQKRNKIRTTRRGQVSIFSRLLREGIRERRDHLNVTLCHRWRGPSWNKRRVIFSTATSCVPDNRRCSGLWPLNMCSGDHMLNDVGGVTQPQRISNNAASKGTRGKPPPLTDALQRQTVADSRGDTDNGIPGCSLAASLFNTSHKWACVSDM